jgi:hypothetical protein
MGVEDCMKQYWILANRVFRPPRQRFIQLYSRKKLQEASRTVVQDFCHCHPDPYDQCTGYEHLRQYDFAEEGLRKNKTCRV